MATVSKPKAKPAKRKPVDADDDDDGKANPPADVDDAGDNDANADEDDAPAVKPPPKKKPAVAKKKPVPTEDDDGNNGDESELTDQQRAQLDREKKTKAIAAKTKLREPKLNVKQRPGKATLLGKLDLDSWTIGTTQKHPNPARALRYYDSMYGPEKKFGPLIEVKGRLTNTPTVHPENGGLVFTVEIVNENEQKIWMAASKKIDALVRQTAIQNNWPCFGNTKNIFKFKNFCLVGRPKSKELRDKYVGTDLPDDLIDPDTGTAIETYPPRIRGALVKEKESNTPKTIIVDKDGKTPLNPYSDFKKGNMVKMLIRYSYGYYKTMKDHLEFGLPSKLTSIIRMDTEESADRNDFEEFGFNDDDGDEPSSVPAKPVADFASDSKAASAVARVDTAASVASTAATAAEPMPSSVLAASRAKILAQAAAGSSTATTTTAKKPDGPPVPAATTTTTTAEPKPAAVAKPDDAGKSSKPDDGKPPKSDDAGKKPAAAAGKPGSKS